MYRPTFSLICAVDGRSSTAILTRKSSMSSIDSVRVVLRVGDNLLNIDLLNLAVKMTVMRIFLLALAVYIRFVAGDSSQSLQR
jgi:hypothetical protein